MFGEIWRGLGRRTAGAAVGIGAAVGASARRARGFFSRHNRIQQLHAEILPACTACGAVSWDKEVEGRKMRVTEICRCGAVRPPVRQLGKIWEKRSRI